MSALLDHSASMNTHEQHAQIMNNLASSLQARFVEPTVHIDTGMACELCSVLRTSKFSDAHKASLCSFLMERASSSATSVHGPSSGLFVGTQTLQDMQLYLTQEFHTRC